MNKLFIILVIVISPCLYSEGNPYLLSIDKISDDVYYDLEGSWKFDLSSAIKGDPTKIFDNYIFKMTPDLTASLWLFNSFFFETEIKELSTNNLFLFGYQGDNYGIQEVRLGNSNFTIGEYAGYKPSNSALYNPGLRTKIVTKNSTQELLFRYTKESRESIKFIGNKQVTETNFQINDYVLGRFFILPNEIDNYTLYSQNNSGDLEIIDRKQYIFFQDKNLLYFLEDNSKIYIETDISKTSLFNFVEGSPSVGSNVTEDTLWDEYSITIQDKELLELYNRGSFSPFQFLGAYELNNEPVDDQSLYVLGYKTLNFEIIDNYLLIYDYSLNQDSKLIRYPFIALDNKMYEIGGKGLNILESLVFSELEDSENFQINDDIRENSFNIKINGINFYDYTFDSETGILDINRNITPFDEIEVTYKKDSDPGIGNLLGVYGGEFSLRDNLTLELSNSGNWNFSTEDYTTELNESTGNLKGIGELNYNGKVVNASLQSSVSITNPDTTSGFELFSYNTQEENLLIDQLILENLITEYNQVKLINRDTSDLLVNYNDLNNYSETGINAPYLINHSINNTSFNSIVIETDTIPEDNHSIAKLKLDKLSNDYSWSKKISLNIYSEENRDILLYFNGVTKTISLSSGSEYKEYIIDLTREERQVLEYLQELDFIINNGDPIKLLINKISFFGDRVWTYDSSNNLVVSKSANNLMIESLNSGDILVSTNINSNNYENYRKLNFELNNNDLISNYSQVIISILNNNGFNREYYVPGELIENGQNSITIYLDSGKGEVNNNSYSSTFKEIENISNNNLLSIKINNASAGNIKVSPMYLKDPVYDISTQHKGYVDISPDISVQVKNIPIVELSNIRVDGKYSENDKDISGQLKGTLLAVGYTFGASINKELESLFYTFMFPSVTSPLYIEDSFSLFKSSVRRNSLILDTNPFELNLHFEGTNNYETYIRKTELETNIKLPVHLGIKGAVKQEEFNETTPSINDIDTSYGEILLENKTDIKNSFDTEVALGTKIGLFSANIAYSGNFLQKWESKYNNYTVYDFDINNDFDFNIFLLSLFLKSNYSYALNKNSNQTLTDGFNEYIEVFSETNPYKDINLHELLFTKSYSNFFDNNLSNGKSLISETGFKLINKSATDNILDIIIPSTVGSSITKNYKLKGDLEVVDINYVVNLDFITSRILKNSIIFDYTQNVLNSDNSKSISIATNFMNEIKKNKTIDISNNFMISDLGYTNITRTDFTWLGKKGPLYIVPVIQYLLDSPYSYTHTERLYLKLENWTYKIGIRHETKLEITETNETEFFIDLGYENESSTPFSFALGIYTTLIF